MNNHTLRAEARLLPEGWSALQADGGLFEGSVAVRERFATACGEVVVRPITPLDAASVDAFVAALSDSSRFRRYHTGLARLSPRQLAAIVDVDHRTGESVVAAHDGQVVGLSQFIELPSDPRAVELAVVVADRWQRLGLGRRLLAAVSRAAAQAGHSHGVALVQGDNRPMLGLLRSSQPVPVMHMDGSLVDVLFQL